MPECFWGRWRGLGGLDGASMARWRRLQGNVVAPLLPHPDALGQINQGAYLTRKMRIYMCTLLDRGGFLSFFELTDKRGCRFPDAAKSLRMIRSFRTFKPLNMFKPWRVTKTAIFRPLWFSKAGMLKPLRIVKLEMFNLQNSQNKRCLNV